MNDKLFAWMRPISINDDITVSWLDHTYVTSYNFLHKYSDIEDVIKAGEHFWYCWGVLDYQGSKLVPNSPVAGSSCNISQSQCICPSNESSAHGTIFKYFRDGVCHQLANQVLYSTTPRTTVENVKGWGLSHFFYGIYGTQVDAWRNLKKQQTTQEVSMIDDNKYAAQIDAVYENLPEDTTPESIRSVESRIHVEHCLGYTLSDENMNYLAEMKEKAIKQREILYEKLESGDISPDDFAEQVNEAHNEILNNIASRISPQEFEKLFSFSSDDKVHLIDPDSVNSLFETNPLIQKE